MARKKKDDATAGDEKGRGTTGADAAKRAVTLQELEAADVRHPIRAATLLYRAPNWVVRGPIYLVFIILFSGIIYSVWARKDEVVAAGLTLQRETVVVEAVGGGMVVDVAALENAAIEAGDPLVTIQEQVRATASPEQEKLMAQLRELEKERDNAKDDYEFQISQLELEQRDLTKRRETDLDALEARIRQIQLELESAERRRNSAASQLSTARSEFARTERLYNSRDITVTEYNAARQRVQDLERAVDDAEAAMGSIRLQLQTARDDKARLEQASDQERFQAEVEKIQANRDRDMERFQERITDIEDRLAEANQLVRGVRYEGNTASYRSSFDGVVSDIHVRRGQLITPGTPIATIIKATSALEALTFVANQDIGHLEIGQPVKIKYYAYPYQDYGIANGVISSIATRPGNEEGQGGMYRVRIALDSETVKHKDGTEKPLEIGLEGVAEIKVGEKRLIELVFSPVSKFFEPPQSDGGEEGGASGPGAQQAMSR